MPQRRTHILISVFFTAAIFSAGIIQTILEIGRGETPRALEVFGRKPTAENLRAYETTLGEASWLGRRLRPWMQHVQFTVLKDAGEKALVGRDGWLFYRPGVEYLTCRADKKDAGATDDDPLPAILSFRDQLAARGIGLLVVPAPNKESIYPERLTRRARATVAALCPRTRDLLQRLGRAGVETVDLFEVFSRAKLPGGQSLAPLYQAQDSHWSPAGIELAAKVAAQYVLERGWVARGAVEYRGRPAPIRRTGDVLRMLQVPSIERWAGPEEVACVQVVRADTGAPYADDPSARVLVLGDSFLRVFERDEPKSAGFIAHLARELGQPLASIVSDGGAATIVRQELYRKAALLADKKLVLWEFVERDIRFGAEGWRIVPLPELPPPPSQVAAK
jgi:hypothetical protein